jgi:invasion protein IalB
MKSTMLSSSPSPCSTLGWGWLRRGGATVTFVSLLALTSSAGAAEQDLGTFKAWRSHAFVESDQQVCAMWSQPTSAKGNYTRRGEIFSFVTHRPAEKARDKVSFEMGYDIEPGRGLKVRIDDKDEFTLVTSGSTAWSDQADVSRAMIRSMKAGVEMVVTGVSTRGTETTDTYSLAGFTAAYGAIGEACGYK